MAKGWLFYDFEVEISGESLFESGHRNVIHQFYEVMRLLKNMLINIF